MRITYGKIWCRSSSAALKQAVHGGVLLEASILGFPLEPVRDGNMLQGIEMSDTVCLDKGRTQDYSFPSCL